MLRDQEKTERAIFYVISLAVGPALAPSLGGYLTNEFTWRLIFFATLPLCLAVLVLAARLVPKDTAPLPHRTSFDFITPALATAALATWMYLFGWRPWG